MLHRPASGGRVFYGGELGSMGGNLTSRAGPGAGMGELPIGPTTSSRGAATPPPAAGSFHVRMIPPRRKENGRRTRRGEATASQLIVARRRPRRFVVHVVPVAPVADEREQG